MTHLPTRPSGLRLPPVKRTAFIWMSGIIIAITTLVWLTFYEIKLIAEDNAPTSAETALCRAELDLNSQIDPAESCPSEAEVIFAARHPFRNALVLGALGFVLGYFTIAFHQSTRSSILGRVHPRPD